MAMGEILIGITRPLFRRMVRETFLGFLMEPFDMKYVMFDKLCFILFYSVLLRYILIKFCFVMLCFDLNMLDVCYSVMFR